MNMRLSGRVPWLALVSAVLLALIAYPGQAAAARAWTIMVYMAADNDLDAAAVVNMNQMECVGSSNDVAIVAQIDRGRATAKAKYDGGWTGARRYLVTRDNNGTVIGSKVLANLGSVDSGKAASLSDFGTWAVRNYPAKRYALIVWSHGTGWLTLAGYSSVQDASSAEKQVADLALPAEKPIPASEPSRGLPAAGAPVGAVPEVPQIQADIAYDDSTKSSLNTVELAAAIKTIVNAAGRPLDIIGFDACLMQNIEVVHALQGLAQFIVGSEETMSSRGWPYVTLLTTLTRRPDLDGRQLATYIPNVMQKAFFGLKGASNALTMSAIDSAQVPGVVKAASDLGYYLYYWSQNHPVWVQAVRDRVQSFSNPDFVDLFHLARLVRSTFKCERTKAAADAVLRYALTAEQRGSPGLVLSRAVNQGRVENALGLSIYFPKLRTRSFDQYHQLAFAKATWWDDFASAYLKNRGTATKQARPRSGTRGRTKERREAAVPVSCAALLDDAAADLIHYRATGDDTAFTRVASSSAAIVDRAILDDDLAGIEQFLRSATAKPGDAAMSEAIRPLLAVIEARLGFAANQDHDGYARELLELLPKRP